MSKLLVVFGATGQQGGSVISYVLNNAELSKQYTIRAVTRDPSSPSAQALQNKNVEVVQADLTEKATLHAALKGADTLFLMTTPSFGPDAKTNEQTQGKLTADVAVAEGVQFIIFSTLPHATALSEGKYTRVTAFDAKAEIEIYIRTLPIKSAFFAPGSFMQNCQTIMLPRPSPVEDGNYVLECHVSPNTQVPLIDTVSDTGKFVGTILGQPDRYEGKTFCAAAEMYSLEEMVQIISRVSGKTVLYKQVSEEEFKKSIPPWADVLIEMMLFQQDFGYYGPETRELVVWARENARGRLTTFEEYLRENLLPL